MTGVRGRMGVVGRIVAPVEVGGRRLPPITLVVLAAIGASLVAIIAATEWRHFNDEYAYWLAGERLAAGAPLYDLAAAPNTPFAYWYPPPLAQVLAPLTSFVAADAFSVAWTVLLLACLWWLAGRDVLIAVLVVLALRRSWAFWVPAAALKITPVLGVVYLAAAGRWRDAVKVAVLGLVVLGVSVALAPGAWREFVDVVGLRAGTDGGSLLPIPFAIRFVAGAILAVLAGLLTAGRVGAGRFPRPTGEALLVVGLTIANPTLWMTAFSLLVAVVPLSRTARSGDHEVAGGPRGISAEQSAAN